MLPYPNHVPNSVLAVISTQLVLLEVGQYMLEKEADMLSSLATLLVSIFRYTSEVSICESDEAMNHRGSRSLSTLILDADALVST